MRSRTARKKAHGARGFALWLTLGALPMGCGEPSQQSAPSAGAAPSAPNVLLLSIDTLRADRLGSWGYALPTSPNIDALAADSVVFLDARSPSPWTLPSLASLMTSTPSSTHEIWRFDARLPDSFHTLAELLSERGFRTAAVGNHTFLAEKFGLHQGFQEFDVSLVQEQLDSHLAVTSPRVSAMGIEWLEKHGRDERPWLLWLHYFDPHAIYQDHSGFSDRFGNQSESELYDGEIAFTDHAIGDVLRAVERLGLDGDTLVVLVADHGEEFQEHGFKGHGRTLHREVLHVPLLIRVPPRVPRIEARRVEGLVSLLDVVPTLLELLELEPPSELAGQSLVGLMRGGAHQHAPVLGEVRLHGPWESLETEQWKLIVSRATGSARLYDLRQDPSEERDVADEHPEIVTRLGAQLREQVHAAREKRRGYQGAPAPELHPAELRRLRELGYLEE